MYSIGLLNSSTQRRSHVMRSHEIFGAKNSFQKHGKRCPYTVDALLDTYYSVNNRRCSFQPAFSQLPGCKHMYSEKYNTFSTEQPMYIVKGLVRL